MSGRICILVLLATVLVPLTGTSAPLPARPYSVRGITLGITLSELRQMAHPDAEQRVGTKLHCSGEPGVGGIEGLVLNPTLLQADALKCGFYHLAPAGEGQRLVGSPIGFLGEEVAPLFLFSKPEGTEDYRLTQITFAMNNRRGSELIGLFYRSFGNAATLDVIGVSTAFGSDMPDIRYIWRNDASTIQLDSISFVLDQMSVVFSENHLWGDLSDRMTAIERMNRIAGEEEDRQKKAAQAAQDAARANDTPPPTLFDPSAAPPTLPTVDTAKVPQ